MPVDDILFSDTGLEFPQMYEHLEKLERYTGSRLTALKPFSMSIHQREKIRR